MELNEENDKHDFSVSSIEGEIGEKEILKEIDKHIADKKLVFQNYRITGYTDVRRSTTYRNKDIDFIIQLVDDKTGKVINRTVEVKTDGKPYPNVFIETKSSKNMMGCLLKTDADIVIYYFITRGCFYVMVPDNYMPLLESLIEEMDEIDERQLATQKNVTAETKRKHRKIIPNTSSYSSGYAGVGYATPIARLEEMRTEMGLIFEKRSCTEIKKAVFDEMVKTEKARRESQAA